MKAVRQQGFDRLSPNGVRRKPIALSLSNGAVPNRDRPKPFALSLSKGRVASKP